jgi:dephospho-CoA kinase
VVKAFGEDVLLPDGRSTARRSAALVFADPEKRRALNRDRAPADRGALGSSASGS